MVPCPGIGVQSAVALAPAANAVGCVPCPSTTHQLYPVMSVSAGLPPGDSVSRIVLPDAKGVFAGSAVTTAGFGRIVSTSNSQYGDHARDVSYASDASACHR